MSQTAQVLAHLRKGRSLTPLTALVRYGCMRLAPRVRELRAGGFQITTTMIRTTSGKRVACYRMNYGAK